MNRLDKHGDYLKPGGAPWLQKGNSIAPDRVPIGIPIRAASVNRRKAEYVPKQALRGGARVETAKEQLAGVEERKISRFLNCLLSFGDFFGPRIARLPIPAAKVHIEQTATSDSEDSSRSASQ